MHEWLRANSYDDVADLIDVVKAENAANGVKTRRNWWVTLAGGENGRPFTVNGREFPVLRAAQIRQGLAITPNAICRNPNEQPLDVVATQRWSRRRLPSKARRPAAKKTRKPQQHVKAG